MRGDDAKFEIIEDSISYTLGDDFANAFKLMMSSDEAIIIAKVAKAYIQQRLATLPTGSTETIAGIPIKEALNILISTIEIRATRDGDLPVYQVGWFNKKSANLAVLLEYGTQAGDDVVLAHPIITNLMIAEDDGSLADIIARMLGDTIETLLSNLRK